jgi:hypothetical protein
MQLHEFTADHVQSLGVPKELISYAQANSIPWGQLLQLILTYGLPFILQFLGINIPLPPLPPLPTPPAKTAPGAKPK